MGWPRWVLPMLALSALLLSACGDDGVEPLDQPDPDEALLQAVPFSEVVQEAFGVAVRRGEDGMLIASDGSQFRALGRLIGHLTSPTRSEMAVFIEYGTPVSLPKPEDTLLAGPGVYMALVSSLPGGEIQYGRTYALAADREAVIPWTEVSRRGLALFPGRTDPAGSVRPAMAVDLDGDGREEMALLREVRGNSVGWREFDLYRWASETQGWTLIGEEGSLRTPVAVLLRYWAEVGSGSAIGARWDSETRLRTVWRWLSAQEEPVTEEMLEELVPDGDSAQMEEEREALFRLRSLFTSAYQRLSEDLKVRQPWSGFINGFKNTEGIDLVASSPPAFQDRDEATVKVLLDETRREGPKLVVRRLLVTTEMVREGDRWYLNDVDAAEEEPALRLTPLNPDGSISQ